MNEDLLFDEIMRRSLTDPWCQECRQDVERFECDYEAIRNQLSEVQQEQLDLYIGACENLEHAFSYIAYEIGSEQGRIRPSL